MSYLLGSFLARADSSSFNFFRVQNCVIVCGVMLYYILIGTFFTGKKKGYIEAGFKIFRLIW